MDKETILKEVEKITQDADFIGLENVDYYKKSN